MRKTVHAACPHDCPDACGVLITVEDGRATRIQGDPNHPVTRGFLCAKVAKYLDRVYSPDRVLYPMRRKGPKGRRPGPADHWERISWDAALDQIVVTDSVSPWRLTAPEVRRKLVTLEVASLFAQAARRMHEGGSIVELTES